MAQSTAIIYSVWFFFSYCNFFFDRLANCFDFADTSRVLGNRQGPLAQALRSTTLKEELLVKNPAFHLPFLRKRWTKCSLGVLSSPKTPSPPSLPIFPFFLSSFSFSPSLPRPLLIPFLPSPSTFPPSLLLSLFPSLSLLPSFPDFPSHSFSIPPSLLSFPSSLFFEGERKKEQRKRVLLNMEAPHKPPATVSPFPRSDPPPRE